MPTAVVVGAGIGGLASAIALRRAGWSVTVLERAERLRGEGAGLVLWPNARHALRALGLDAAVARYGHPVPAAAGRRPDGRILSRVEFTPLGDRLGAPIIIVHRQDLHATLVEALDEVPVRLGVQVSGLDPDRSAPAVLDHTGRRWAADLVVAADGIASPLRTQLWPAARIADAGYLAWRAVVPADRAPELEIGGETLGVGHRFGCQPMGARGVYWYATAPGPARDEPPAAQLDRLRTALGGWHHPVGALLAATHPTDLLRHPVTDLRPMPDRFDHPIGTGGLVLVGDAAHAMTPNLGQGACLALEDAVTLGAVVAARRTGPALHTALADYHQRRYRRTARLNRQARQLGLALELRRPTAIRLRDLVAATLPDRITGRMITEPARWQPPDPASR